MGKVIVTDTVSPSKRSAVMAAVKQKNTKPELFVRSFLHKRGLRFRIHAAELPGKPDILLPKYRVALFVHGCFWHGHASCKLARIPKTNVEFWLDKITGNAKRDAVNQTKLSALGWSVVVIWECDLKNKDLAYLVRIIKSRGPHRRKPKPH
jgi:DNA mismatch endonuclease (patch repair protein)